MEVAWLNVLEGEDTDVLFFCPNNIFASCKMEKNIRVYRLSEEGNTQYSGKSKGKTLWWFKQTAAKFGTPFRGVG
jgi:hypothetical protein